MSNKSTRTSVRTNTRAAAMKLFDNQEQGLVVWAAPANRKAKAADVDVISKNLGTVNDTLKMIADALTNAPSSTKTSKFTVEFGLSIKASSGALTKLAIGSVEGDAHLTITMEWSKTDA